MAGNTHFGETAIAAGGVTSGLLSVGQRVTWQARHFWVRQTLTSEITAMQPPVYFQDKMIGGAFHSMDHDHCFRALSPERTEMKDIFRFTAPIPVLGRIAEALVLRRYMGKLLRERNAVIKEIAESGQWRNYLPWEDHRCES
ncbi:MAG TPA: SRPBCC family protein [Candidatus Acidoferrales bacterium]|nr:SRPBCC family protein [Candidatus Acidoferrales bacterium]